MCAIDSACELADANQSSYSAAVALRQREKIAGKVLTDELSQRCQKVIREGRRQRRDRLIEWLLFQQNKTATNLA